MKVINKELVVIGGGPAGLAAALEAERLGMKDILVLERNEELGGILEQCIHDGFGVHRFKKQLSGPQYAQMFIDQLEGSIIETKLNTMVLEITKDKIIYGLSSEDGIFEIHAKAIILAMGCRERSKSQVFILGTRPSGIMTAGTVQRYINMEGLIPGKKAVILGSGDIGMIMARRMILEGMEVEGVYEVMNAPGGLARNVFQCLDDYNIPLHLSTTITKGPYIDGNMMTNIEGIFAAGNVANVFDLVDYVSDTGEIAARGAYKYIHKQLETDKSIEIVAGDNVSFLIPNRYKIEDKDSLSLYFRTKLVIEKAEVSVWQNNQQIYIKRHQIVRPQEMILACLNQQVLAKIKGQDPIMVKISKVGE